MVKNHGMAPIYALNDLRYLIQEDAWEYGSRTCKRDVDGLGLLRHQVKRMLLSLTTADHHKGIEDQGSDFGSINVDAYRLYYDEDREMRCAPGDGLMFYVKLGVHSDDQGDLCVVASFHLDRQR